MNMRDIIRDHPEWTDRVQVEAWLTAVSREAGEAAEFFLADFGARLDPSGQADVSHLPESDVKKIKADAIEYF